jgi:hypothetical protein
MVAAHSISPRGGLLNKSKKSPPIVSNSSSSYSGEQVETSGGSMTVNSLDVDANNWSIGPVTDRKGAPKTIRLKCEDRRDVYADADADADSTDSHSSVGSNVDGVSPPTATNPTATTATAAADTTTMADISTYVPTTTTTTTATPSATSTTPSPTARLCYKWSASAELKTSVASKTSGDSASFRQLTAQEYFEALPEGEIVSQSPGTAAVTTCQACARLHSIHTITFLNLCMYLFIHACCLNSSD